MFERDQTDQHFAEYCRTGAAEALGAVFDSTAPRLLRTALWLTGDRADAEDVVQRTFLQAIATRERFEQGRPALPWLLGLLGNQARKQRQQRLQAAVPLLPCADDRNANPQGEVAVRELERALGRLGDTLGEPYRSVLRLHLEEGLNAKEIASRLQRPAGTVRTQLMRALELVRRRLPKGFDESRGVIAVMQSQAMIAARTAVVEAARTTAPGVVSSALASSSLAKLVVSKLLVAPLVVVMTVAAWWTLSARVGSGGQTAPAEMRAELDLAAGLAPTGDPDLDELRLWALKSPIEELESHMLVFLVQLEETYPSDVYLWHGMERLVDRLLRGQHASWPRLNKQFLIQTIEAIGVSVMPKNALRLRERIPEMRRVR